ncbi:hypothetical protein Lepto7376_3751 [[Leptolyngbya] sp. PCC 7376]|uniref:hypothetical protein n=1 Tax=[Leptolyngbya] sp. PCC 7376 TaxID=111781 RepID=UPI00029EC981|nr:hypothetical protein [[Leptolyngbya] sp. PCC 7376]AFY39925.1 hypothetical protein Lepto7376_3751 [[Leptolyngbya] sp. PCC 7376]
MSDSKKGGAIAREIFTREVHYSEPISTETSSDSDSDSTLVWLLNQPLFWIAVGAVAITLMTDDRAPVIINNQAPPPIIINN